MAAQANQIGYGTAAPTDTTQYWSVGDIIINNGPTTSTGYVYGFRCVASGYPGTWVNMFNEPMNVATTTATTGTFTGGVRLQLLNAAAGTYALPLVSLYPACSTLTVINTANVNATLTPQAANNYNAAAAITLTQHQKVTLISYGSGTTWYGQS